MSNLETSAVQPDDVDRMADQIEMAAIYVQDGAYETALSRLRDAMPVLEAVVEHRRNLFRLTRA